MGTGLRVIEPTLPRVVLSAWRGSSMAKCVQGISLLKGISCKSSLVSTEYFLNELNLHSHVEIPGVTGNSIDVLKNIKICFSNLHAVQET